MNILISAIVSGVVFVWMVVMILTRKSALKNISNKYSIATTAVYLSGTLLILAFAFFMTKLPLVFVIISEVSIFTFYLITFFFVLTVQKKIGEIMKDYEDGKIKGVEDDGEKAEDTKD